MINNIASISVCIDYLRFVFPCMAVGEVLHLLGLSEMPFDDVGGHYHYKHSLMLGHTYVYYGGHDNMGVCVQMSGQGCREYYDLTGITPEQLVQRLKNENAKVKFKRIDIAIDDKDYILSIEELVNDFEASNFKSCAKSSKLYRSKKSNSQEGITLEFGTNYSARHIRIYDKAAEQGMPDTHWIRVEQAFSDEAADSAADFIVKHGLIDAAQRTLANNLVFLAPSNDRNKSRWQVRPYWQRVIGTGSGLLVTTNSGGALENFRDSYKSFLSQYSGLLQTILYIVGLDDFLDDVFSRSIINNKHKVWLKIYEGRTTNEK